jgi:hypothetical protein
VRGKIAGLVVMLLASGCTRPRTELIVGVITDLSAQDMINRVELHIDRQGVPLFSPTWVISGSPDMPEELPGSYGIYSSDGSETTVTLTAQGFAPGSALPVVERTATLSLVHEETLFMRLALIGACETMACPSGANCVEGYCRPKVRDAHTFPPYKANMEKVLACNSGPKYRNTSTKQLMTVTGDCPPNQDCIEGTCYKHSSGGTVAADMGGGGDGGMGTNCDPLAQTGCATGQKCYVAVNGQFLCKSVGTKTLGQTCTSGVGDDCIAGLHCASDGTPPVCRAYCRTDSDCTQAPAASGGTPEPTNVPRCFEALNASTVKLCSLSCDPIGAGAGCPTGRACGFFQDGVGDEYTDCYAPGSVGDGQVCMSVSDCTQGETCAATGTMAAHCRKACRTAGGVTNNGDCSNATDQCNPLGGVSNPIFSACCPPAGC